MKSIQNVPALPPSNLDLVNVSVVVTRQLSDNDSDIRVDSVGLVVAA